MGCTHSKEASSSSGNERERGTSSSPPPPSFQEAEHDELFSVSSSTTTTTTTSKKNSSSKNLPFRLLTLQGQTGAVFCRVHDQQAMSTTPSLSENGRFEFATRSLLRMFNLVVFRGRDRDSSMIGPGDYYCNVEKPHASAFTIEGLGGDNDNNNSSGTTAGGTVTPPPEEGGGVRCPKAVIPRFVPHAVEAAHEIAGLRPVSLETDCITVKAEWISGQLRPELIKKKKEAEYVTRLGAKKDPFGGSLFPHPGLLEIQPPALAPATAGGGDGNSSSTTREEEVVVSKNSEQKQLTGEQEQEQLSFTFPNFDATKVDLSSFFARLVRNDHPFRITDRKIKSKDEYRPVSYEFGPKYAESCMSDESGGLFLETHDFTQTMTPLDADCGGFIVLGRWRDGRNGHKNLHEQGVDEKQSRVGCSSKKKRATPSPPPSFSSCCSPSLLEQEENEITSPLSTLTPAEKDGFKGPQLLDLLAVKIPFGFTLLVDRGCMHGDSTFIGNYMMSMTSNHEAMGDADTVFLKDASTKRNVKLLRAASLPPASTGSASVPMSTPSANTDGDVQQQETAVGGTGATAVKAPRPIMVYQDATKEELDHFVQETKGMSFMLQPFSKLSWVTTMYRRFGVAPGMKFEK